MKSIEFYDLPRPIQERFVAAAQATLAPAPLAIKLASRYVGFRWFIASAVLFALSAAFAMRGFGDLTHPAALASSSDAVIYCIGFTLSFACLTRGLVLRDRASSLPFPRATYLFPMGVVEALSSTLQVFSLLDLTQVEATASSLNISFKDGTTFQFPAKNQEQAEAAKATVVESRERLEEATRTDNVRHLAALDPLCRTNFPSPFSHDVPFKRPTALWATALLGLAVLSGAVLGYGVWQVRNTLSGRRLVSSARALDSIEAYRQYLARGGQNPEIVQVALPRAELAEAKAKGDVAAIEEYIRAHPDSKIQGEVNEALKSALLAALDTARAPGTLAALDEFAKRYPNHAPVAEELARARHEVYTAAAARAAKLTIENQTRQSNPSPFFQRLVAYAEKHGPKVEIRFRSQLGKSHASADSHVRSSSYFAGNASLPSRFFVDEHMRRREAMAGALLVQALQSLFAEEIVKFELGEPLPAVAPDERVPPWPEPTVPTLFIHHRTELSGGHVNPKPRGIFMGAGIFFDTDFVIPGDERELELNVPTWRTPARKVMRHKTRTTADVYEDLARRSFNLFLRRYFERIFDKPPALALPEIELPDDGSDKSDPDPKDDDEKEETAG